jgi:HK97 family phage prohead protease
MSKKKERTKLRKIILIPVATKVIKETEDAGIVEHFFAVMGNIDHDRDRIMPGAFSKTLEGGVGRIRVLDSHNFSSATDALGSSLKIEEVGRERLPDTIKSEFPDAVGAMRAETRFNLKTQKGHDTFHLLKAGDLDEWSFGYANVRTDFETVQAVNDRRGWTLSDAGEEIRIQNLRELELFEYSPVIWGANSATSTVGAKSHEDQEIDIELHKRLVAKYEERRPEAKSTDLRSLIRSLSIAFYNQFPDTEQNVYWVIEVWDTHLIILDEGEHGEKHWRVNYHLDQDQAPVFAHADEWAEVEQVWVDKGKKKEISDEELLADFEKSMEYSVELLQNDKSVFNGHKIDQPIGAALQQSVMAVATTQLDEWLKDGMITPDQFVVLSASVGKTMGAMAIAIPQSVKALQVPASLIVASKNGSVITTQKVTRPKQEEAEEDNSLSEESEESKQPQEAEPPKKALTSDGDEAYAQIQEMKQK